jgi:16S rRNA (cytosine1402-N4)-methyltransferase
MVYHKPVLLQESVDGLNIRPDGIYVDTTFGGGGHSKEILKRLGKKGLLIGFDQDNDAQANIPNDKRFLFADNNFRFIRNYLRLFGIDKVDGILADLGVSSHHFDTAERGFSFRFDEKLDMRMNQGQRISAATIINQYTEDKLTTLFKEYGEIGHGKKLAAEIISARSIKPIETTGELKDLVGKAFGKKAEINLAPQAFQALRIEVNKELKALEELLEASLDILNPEGRLVIISYHSLEDKMVKNFMKSGKLSGEIQKDFFGNTSTPFEIISRKAIVPTDEEQKENPRSRSAKLRIAELL